MGLARSGVRSLIIMLCGQHRQCYVGEMFDEKFEILSAELRKKLVTTLA